MFNLLLIYLFKKYIYVCVSVGGYAHLSAEPAKARFLGVGVSGSCERPNPSTGKGIQVLTGWQMFLLLRYPSGLGVIGFSN